MNQRLFFAPANAGVTNATPYCDGLGCGYLYHKAWPGYDAEDRADGLYALTAEAGERRETPLHMDGLAGCFATRNGARRAFYSTSEGNAVYRDDADGRGPFLACGPDASLYDPAVWADPFVYYNEDEGLWWMLTRAVAKGTVGRRGCVGLSVSEDLDTWTCREPLYAPGSFVRGCAYPSLIRLGDWYYLIFSVDGEQPRTCYRMGRSPRGPWLTPVDDALDGHGFYAGRAALLPGGGTLAGVCPSKVENADRFDPVDYERYDYHTWDDCGAMIAHRLYATTDGTLGVGAPPEARERASVRNRVRLVPLNGQAEITTGGLSLTAPHGCASAMTWNRVPEVCRLCADISHAPGTRGFSVAMQVDEKFARGYYYLFEPDRNRVQWKSPIRMHGEGGWTFPFEVELERPLALDDGRANHIELLVDGSIAVLYVDDRVALTARCYDYHHRRFGFSVSDGAVNITNIALYTEGGA